MMWIWISNYYATVDEFRSSIQTTRGPFYQRELTLIPAWMSNHIHYKMWNELSINSKTPTVTQLKFRNGYVTLSHTLLDMGLLIHAGI